VVDPVDATGPDLAGVIADVLAENGPLTEEQLLAALVTRGVVLGGEPSEELDAALDRGDGLVVSLADDRRAWLPALLAGRVFTHRLTADEVAHDLLRICPDLEPLSVLLECEDYQSLSDGAPVALLLATFDAEVLQERGIPAEVLDQDGGLLLPTGYLPAAGVGAGDVIGIGLSMDGLRLTAGIELTDRAEDLADLANQVNAVLAERLGEPVALDTGVWTACAEVPELFRVPLPPLAETLGGLGLDWQGEWLAAAGFDFADWRVRNKVHHLADRYDLDEDAALAVAATVHLYEKIAALHAAARAALEAGGPTELSTLLGIGAGIDTHTGTDPREDGEPDTTPPVDMCSQRERDREDDPDEPAEGRVTVGSAMVLLVEPAVAEAVLAETLGSDLADAAALGLFAETAEPLAPRPARVALRWLRAKAHERLGELTEAEQAYSHAQALDPDWPLVLWDLARYASDRGDAVRGLSLLRRAGAPAEDDLVEMLIQHQPRPRPDMGRNQRCWCGSGRKYKQCHLGREVLALDERVGWLYHKAGMFLLDGPWWDTVIEVGIKRSRYAKGVDAVRAAVSDPLVTDAVLFEGGVFAEFLDARGVLLPDDERLLADQWLLVERSVHEVEQAERGRGLTLRDVRTGDIHQVHERSASTQLRTGELVCARVVPAGDTMGIFGGIEPVGLGQRDELIALLDNGPDPIELVEFLTRRFAPASPPDLGSTNSGRPRAELGL
jgi:tetratricopeptide (TPR) repeat protein